jgi:predicted ATP-grasp superfamily ATP-dependent carboligase
MLWAVLADFHKTRRHDTVTLVHESLPHLPPGEVRRVRNAAEEREWFEELAGGAEAVLLIAPETAGLLDERSGWVEAVGGRLLGCTAAARRLTASKAALGRHWQATGVPTPAVLAVGADVAGVREFPCVLKPADGAGSQDTFAILNGDELRPALAQATPRRWVAQRFAPGLAASVAFLVGPAATIPLPPALQQLSDDGRFHYLGGAVPLPGDLGARAVRLARRAVAAVPGLRGYVGVDLVLGDAADGSGDFAIEINPRLTTSYLGLRMLTRDNLAEALLRGCRGEPAGPLRWEPGHVRFSTDGSCIESQPGPLVVGGQRPLT